MSNSEVLTNKLANFERLATLTSSLDLHFPETLILASDHYESALRCVGVANPKSLMPDAISDAHAESLREALLVHPLPEETELALDDLYRRITSAHPGALLSVRSCFELEDTQDLTLSGAFETVLSVSNRAALSRAVQLVFSSVFNLRAVDQLRTASLLEAPTMSVAIQPMLGGPGWRGGVCHTQHPDLLNHPILLITTSLSAAEVTAGEGVPEEYLVNRSSLDKSSLRSTLQRHAGSQTSDEFLLDDAAVSTLARHFVALEDAFGVPLEIEWLQSPTGDVFILQVKPTPHAVISQGAPLYGSTKDPICQGLPVGNGYITAEAIHVSDLGQALAAPPGKILVASSTTPDWVPALRRAVGLVTAVGARTSHVSRCAREFGVLSVVSCGPEAFNIPNGKLCTINCHEGLQASVYQGTLSPVALTDCPHSVTVSSPSLAFSLARTVSPTRVVFDPQNTLSALRLPSLIDDHEHLPDRLRRRIAGYSSLTEFVTEKLVESVSLIAVAFPIAQLSLRPTGQLEIDTLFETLRRRLLDEQGIELRFEDRQ